jgi:death-on-curing protein
MNESPTWLIAVDRVHALHDHAIKQWGGAAGIRNQGCVEGSVGNSLNAGLYAMDSEDDEPDVLTVSAHLLFYLARNHCYTDGNKRIAWLAFTDQIGALGLDVEATQAEVIQFVLEVAAGTIANAEGVRDWVAPRLIAAP